MGLIKLHVLALIGKLLLDGEDVKYWANYHLNIAPDEKALIVGFSIKRESDILQSWKFYCNPDKTDIGKSEKNFQPWEAFSFTIINIYYCDTTFPP